MYIQRVYPIFLGVMMMMTYHSINMAFRTGERSLISQAAGRPVTRVKMPRMRKVHAGLTRCMRNSIMKLITAPPIPPPA